MATDYSQLPDTEFWDVHMAVLNEAKRRRLRQEAPAKQELLNLEVLNAEGIVSGSEWRQPLGGHDAYPVGFQVLRNGILYENLVSANVWEPGIDPMCWKDLTTVTPQGIWDPNSYVYVVDDEVLYDGAAYICIQDHTSQAGWTPPAVPALWQLI